MRFAWEIRKILKSENMKEQDDYEHIDIARKIV
jgi:hypothetical protein